MTAKTDDAPGRYKPRPVQWAATYGAGDIHNALATMSTDDIDQLPFGVIKVDRKGKILLYNVTEGRLARLAPADVLGRNFFRDIAPCTNRPEFLGRFLDGLAKGNLDVTFRYVFSFRMRPTIVTVNLRNSYFDDTVWILIDWTMDIEQPRDRPPPVP